MAAKGYLIGPSLVTKIKDTIARVDGIPHGSGGDGIETRFESVPAYVPKPFYVCTFTGTWAVNSDKAVTFRGVTATPNTVLATNLLVSLPAKRNPSSPRVVNIARDGTAWYLVSFEMATATAVFSSGTQTLTVVGTAGSQVISYVSGTTSSQTVVTDIAASLNTSNCSITVTKTTATVTTIATTQRTAAIFTASGTQTMTATTGTYTATIVTLEM
jgi:hypothetical protein